ncbi:MAG: 5-carboxymethyl-2-hydroxymuconate Delta-isomerase [Oxalobacteraceae bacterium]|nr:MAG: 5-carboxymethyl-2-hydroxymuconate Delta-isomerase [Oxalobacteraceae bacterium]
MCRPCRRPAAAACDSRPGEQGKVCRQGRAACKLASAQGPSSRGDSRAPRCLPAAAQRLNVWFEISCAAPRCANEDCLRRPTRPRPVTIAQYRPTYPCGCLRHDKLGVRAQGRYSRSAMPHCLLEYTDNVVDSLDPRALFAELHQALMELEAFALADVKSRAVCLRDHYIADGSPDNAFAHLRFSLLSGRDISVLQRITQTCLKVLERHFEKTMHRRVMQLSVEVCQVDRSTYAKTVSTQSR